MKKILFLFYSLFAFTFAKAQLSVNITTIGAISCGVPDTLMANASGGTGPYTYSWSNGATQQIANITPTGTTLYTVTVTDAVLATAWDTLTISFPPTNIYGTITSTVGPTNGIVTLYKFVAANAKLDSITSVNIAPPSYTFNAIPSGSYIVKATLLDTTVQQTYGSSSISWKNATGFNHTCANNSTMNITVIPIINLGPGPGELSGKIVEGVGYSPKGTVVPGNPIGGLSVKGGKNPGGGIVAQSKTNAAGEYTLRNFPVNSPGESYFILIDIPGLDTNNTYHKAITTGTTLYTGLNFVVDSAKINPTQDVSVRSIYKLSNGIVKVYPNPTNGIVNIDLVLFKPESIEIRLNDITGKEVKTILSSGQNFNTEIKVQADLKDLNKGIYAMKIKIGETEQTVKLILSN